MFYRNIKVLREFYGLSQQQLADRIGAKRSTYSSWESGATEPSLHYIDQLQLHLSVGADVLIRGALYAYTPAALHELVHSGNAIPRPKVA